MTSMRQGTRIILMSSMLRDDPLFVASNQQVSSKSVSTTYLIFALHPRKGAETAPHCLWHDCSRRGLSSACVLHMKKNFNCTMYITRDVSCRAGALRLRSSRTRLLIKIISGWDTTSRLVLQEEGIVYCTQHSLDWRDPRPIAISIISKCNSHVGLLKNK